MAEVQPRERGAGAGAPPSIAPRRCSNRSAPLPGPHAASHPSPAGPPLLAELPPDALAAVMAWLQGDLDSLRAARQACKQLRAAASLQVRTLCSLGAGAALPAAAWACFPCADGLHHCSPRRCACCSSGWAGCWRG
jgi:hypothetical protein